MPPRMKAIGTTIGLSSISLMYLCSATPITAAGRKATMIAVAKRIDVGSRRTTPPIVAKILA